MFPIRDDNPQILVPYATFGIAAGAALVMLLRKPELLHRHPYYGWKKRSPTANWHRVDKRWRE